MLPKKYILPSENDKHPDGFILNPSAFYDFIESNKLETKIQHLLGAVHEEFESSAKNVKNHILNLILKSEFPEEIIRNIISEYKKLGDILEEKSVYVCFINENCSEEHKIKGDASLVHKIKEKWATIYFPNLPVGNPTIVIHKTSKTSKLEQEKVLFIIKNSQWKSI